MPATSCPRAASLRLCQPGTQLRALGFKLRARRNFACDEDMTERFPRCTQETGHHHRERPVQDRVLKLFGDSGGVLPIGLQLHSGCQPGNCRAYSFGHRAIDELVACRAESLGQREVGAHDAATAVGDRDEVSD